MTPPTVCIAYRPGAFRHVEVNGTLIPGCLNAKVSASTDGVPTVTLEMVAKSVAVEYCDEEPEEPQGAFEQAAILEKVIGPPTFD